MSGSNIIKFRSSASPDDVLDAAKGVYDSVFIIGWDKDDFLDARTSDNLSKKSDILYLIEAFKHKLMSGDYDD